MMASVQDVLDEDEEYDPAGDNVVVTDPRLLAAQQPPPLALREPVKAEGLGPPPLRAPEMSYGAPAAYPTPSNPYAQGGNPYASYETSYRPPPPQPTNFVPPPPQRNDQYQPL